MCFKFFSLYAQESNCLVMWSHYINYWRNRQTVLHSGYTIVHSHQQCMSVPPLHLHPRFLFSIFKNSHLVGVKWYRTVVLICISPMTNDDEHLFMCLMVISISPWRNIYSNLSHSFKLGWLLDRQSSLYIMNTNKYMVCKYFSHTAQWFSW